MKVTVKQLKQLIREQVEEEMEASRHNDLKKFVLALGDHAGWFDASDAGRAKQNVTRVFVEDDELVIVFRNGDTLEQHIRDIARGLF
jgi:hypothetical protein